MPDARTMEAFFDEVLFVENKSRLDRALRGLLLWSVAQHIELEKVGFDRAFLRFLERSRFLLDFFDEIEAAKISLQNIDTQDTYGDYSDHLRVLNNIHLAYKSRLEELGLYDTPTHYRLHAAFLRYYDNIRIHLDGILSPLQLEILQNAAKITNIELVFECDRFNISILKKTLPQSVALECGFAYVFSLSKNEIVQKMPIAQKSPNVALYGFSTRINQAALVISKVNEWLKKGCESIVVVLPSEDFARFLEIFDWARNLNYAMGVRDLGTIQRIQKLKTDVENGADVFGSEEGSSKLERVLSCLKRLDRVRFEALSLTWSRLSETFEALSYAEILDFVLQNLQNEDDTSGGKVKVVGVLETRGLSFEKVIILDCNKEFLPQIGEGDLFLNSALRHKSKLPTLQEKESLQLSHYARLINNANEVCLSFCQNALPSSLLSDFGLDSAAALNGERLWRLLPKPEAAGFLEEDFLASYDGRLSSSSVKAFLGCKARFYFKYIQQLFSKEDEENAKIGILLHDFLKRLGNDFSPNNRKEVLGAMLKELNLRSTGQLDLEIGLKKLEPFFEEQIAALKKGRVILECEKGFSANLFGLEFYGRIDRVDRLESGEIRVIDYKFKKNFNARNEGFLQLVLYKMALGGEFRGATISAAYYDLLKNEEIVMSTAQEDEAVGLLESAAATLQGGDIVFEKTQNHSECKYCDFKYLCDRF